LLTLQNWEVAATLARIGQLLALKGDNPFKSQAYARAARAVKGLRGDIGDYHQKGTLTSIPGVGHHIAQVIAEMVSTGQSAYMKSIESDFPADFLDILAVPGIGLATGRTLYHHLGVASLADLQEAVERKEVRKLPGLGPKTEQRIKEGLRLLQEGPKEYNLGVIAPLARDIEDRIQSLDFVRRTATAGEFRRRVEAVTALEFIVSTSEVVRFQNFLEKQPFIREIKGQGRVIKAVSLWQIPLLFHLVEEDSFWSSLLMATGSQKHIEEVAAKAAEKNLEITPQLFAAGEKEFYRQLGSPWIPPELREGRGELEAAMQGSLPSLVALGDIKGDLHTHSNWSDGTESILQMLKRAKEKGYQYLAVTDHSPSLKIAGGLSLDQLKKQVEEISRLKEEHKGFTIFTGMEVDILRDGKLDLPDEVMAELDVVIASIHTGFRQPAEQLTQRMMAAMENPYVHIIGHPTGRLIGRRDPYPIDVGALLEKAAETGKALEINASPDRLDLKDIYVQRGRELGVIFAVNTDTHSLAGLDDMEFGITAARRGWLEAKDVLNTWDVSEVKAFLRRGS
jgi:DNA polymerase (family X)